MGARRRCRAKRQAESSGKKTKHTHKHTQRDPRRRARVPERYSSSGEAHTPPGHAPPAALSRTDGKRAAAPPLSRSHPCMRCVQANGAPCASTTALHIVARGTLGLSKRRYHRLSTKTSLSADCPSTLRAAATPARPSLLGRHSRPQARLNRVRALAWPCSVPPPRTWLASASLRVPAAK